MISKFRKRQLATHVIDGLSIVVEVPRSRFAGYRNAGTVPRLEVGTVTGPTLGSMSDRVMVKLRISKRYRYLVRNNSAFYGSSGYNLDFGLIGGVGENRDLQPVHSRRYRFCDAAGTAAAPKRRMVNTSCCWKANWKEWREWGTALAIRTKAPVSVAGAFMVNCAPFFLWCAPLWLKTQSIFLTNSFRSVRDAMPTHLSFDAFIAACQRRYAAACCVNTLLKISVADFLQQVAPYGWQLTPIPWCEEGLGSNAMMRTPAAGAATAEHLSGL